MPLALPPPRPQLPLPPPSIEDPGYAFSSNVSPLVFLISSRDWLCIPYARESRNCIFFNRKNANPQRGSWFARDFEILNKLGISPKSMVKFWNFLCQVKLGRCRIEDFVLGRILGTGSFGRVYLTRQKNRSDAVFATKALTKALILRQKQVKLFSLIPFSSLLLNRSTKEWNSIGSSTIMQCNTSTSTQQSARLALILTSTTNTSTSTFRRYLHW
jgi:hypothetical protein